jgi:ADP-ribose pyrophosphatase YjhB (NUDIX family)
MRLRIVASVMVSVLSHRRRPECSRRALTDDSGAGRPVRVTLILGNDHHMADLPAIPVSAGALIFDQAGRLLILKPTYKTGWTIPGGIMEADGETPWDACRREVREECGIEVRSGRLACVDFRPGRPGRPGGIRFLFDCGPADNAMLAAITIQPEEIAEYRLVPLGTALTLLRPPIRRRVRAVSRHRRFVYLEDGRPVPGVS